MVSRNRSLISVVFTSTLIVILGIVFSALLSAMALADTWSNQASAGFDGNYSASLPSASSLAYYNGNLYVGTESANGSSEVFRINGGGGWDNVNDNGFGYPGNVEVTAMTEYDGSLFAGTRNQGPLACGVWRYDGNSWSAVRVFGLGDLGNSAVSSMAVLGSDLYVGTANDSGCEVMRLRNGSWSRVNDQGFGTDQNKSVSSLAAWNGSLYAGTENSTSGCHVYAYDGTDWKQLTSDGFGDKKNIAASSMTVFGGNLYLGTDNGPSDVSDGCQVWAYDGSGWSQSASKGFGDSNNEKAACMAVYNSGSGNRLYLGTKARWNNPCHVWAYDGSNPWYEAGSMGLGDFLNTGAVSMGSFNGGLYVGTLNDFWQSDTDRGTGCEVIRYDWSGQWNCVSRGGFTSSNNHTVSAMATLNGSIFAGTASGAGCEVWRNDGGDGWNMISSPGFGDGTNSALSSMAVDNTTGTLYAGTYNPVTGCGVWRYDGGNSWTKINKNGFGDQNNREASSMAVFDSHLYVGTYSPWTGGCEVWRYEGFDGSDHVWTTVVGPGAAIGNGFGRWWNPMACSMAVGGSSLYVGTLSWDHGCEIWSTTDGTGWSLESEGGFGDSNNQWATAITTFNGGLYVGTKNWQHGCAVYENSGSGWQRVSDSSMTDSNSTVSSMSVVGPRLFVGTRDGNCQVWSTYDGTSWEQANSNGFGDGNNEGVTSMTSRVEGLGARLYCGTFNLNDGAGVEAIDTSIDSCNPPFAVQGSTLDVAISGSNTHFEEGVSRATFSGDGITVNSTHVKDAGHAVANITVSPTATPLPCNVNVITGPETPDQRIAGFTVLLPGIPAISSLSPGAGAQHKTVNVDIVGTNTHFIQGQSNVTFSGSGIKVNSLKVKDVTHATAGITIADGAALRARTVNVTTGIEVPVPLQNAFEVTYGRAHLWYLAEGCTASGFETWVLVQNPNDTAADVTLTYMTASGPVAGPAATLPAHSRVTFDVADKVPDQYEVSTMITSSLPVVAERSMYGNKRTWGTDSLGVCSPSRTWYLPEGCTGPGFETWILVQNPNRTPASVTLEYMTPRGKVAGPTVDIAANSRKTFNVADTVPGAWEVSTKVTANKPVVAERSMYGNGRQWAHDSIGATQGATGWCLPEGSTGPGFETWVLVQNPGEKPAKASLTYMTDRGEVKGPVLDLEPGTRRTVRVADTVPGNWSVSTTVESDEPVIAERSMYGNSRHWGTDSIGLSKSARTWCLAEGSTGPGFETWVLLQNPGDETATVSLTYMTDRGAVSGPVLSLRPGTRKTVNVADKVPGSWGVSTFITSDRPVTVERSMYGNNREWAHDSIGFAW